MSMPGIMFAFIYWWFLFLQVNVNLAGLPALVLPCGFIENGPTGLPVGLQMIGAAFNEVLSFLINYTELHVDEASLCIL
jgi:Asp-tRNA(Asn)/Glu-tRNA(Gln) amidotransferase A subunit family amidase